MQILKLDGATLFFNPRYVNTLISNKENLSPFVYIINGDDQLVGNLSLFSWNGIPLQTIEKMEDSKDRDISNYLELCFLEFVNKHAGMVLIFDQCV